MDCAPHDYDDRVQCQGAIELYQVPDRRCSNCSSIVPEVASSTLGVSYGGFPLTIRSGVVASLHQHQIVPYVKTTDFYDQLSPLDDTTTCSVRRMDDGNFTGTKILPNGAVTKSNVVVVDGNAVSARGKVAFNRLVLKGDIGVVYFVEATCTGHPGIKVFGNMTIGPCAPGEALDATRSCKECPEDTYSPRGEACLACPPGGNCTTYFELVEKGENEGEREGEKEVEKEVEKENKENKEEKGSSNTTTTTTTTTTSTRPRVTITQGVATPYTIGGWWLYHAPTHLSTYDPTGYCDFQIGQCVPGEKEVIVKRRDALTKSIYEDRVCRPVNEVGDEIHDALSLFQCVEHLHFYPCPLGAIACLAGQSNPMLPRCALGYRGPKCALCEVNHWKTADDTCQVCADMGGKTNARVLYGLMFVGSVFVGGAALALYLQEDNGRQILSGLHKCLCCGCVLHQTVYRKCCYNEQKTLLKQRLKNSDEKTTASAVNEGQWFRPEKFKILLSFVQIFSQVKQNYGVPWPSAISDYMRALAFFNLDLFNLAAMDCIVTSNYFMGLMVVTSMPIAGALVLLGLLNYGRSAYIERLDNHPRKCVLCHHPVKEFMSPLAVLELRHRNVQKGLLEHAINPEAGLPSKFECRKCQQLNSRTKVVEKYGPDIMKWKCTACAAPYKDRKKYAKGGRNHIKQMHNEASRGWWGGVVGCLVVCWLFAG